ncbi:hypothetical protein PGS50_15605 [Yersinia intermedia]|uniref:hypothetical protein n=2 Tax=Yersinia intermedia TaxID=631 RepID=UPI0021BD75DF|nr:hypothetical protein [Yersinia intermedia]MDA5494672.1 hypothetical protein [Yersinia intermedia]
MDKPTMKPPLRIVSIIFLTLLVTSCSSLRKTVYPPPYLGSPTEISTYEVKGLHFVTTVTFNSMFAEQQIKEYAEKHHYRYYVIIRGNSGANDFVEKMSAKMYR